LINTGAVLTKHDQKSIDDEGHLNYGDQQQLLGRLFTDSPVAPQNPYKSISCAHSQWVLLLQIRRIP